jgi:hypothetical protein
VAVAVEVVELPELAHGGGVLVDSQLAGAHATHVTYSHFTIEKERKITYERKIESKSVKYT